eukprot:scaffold287752_cov18-Prasinocladus_malaysianus.AAC.1
MMTWQCRREGRTQTVLYQYEYYEYEFEESSTRPAGGSQGATSSRYPYGISNVLPRAMMRRQLVRRRVASTVRSTYYVPVPFHVEHE